MGWKKHSHARCTGIKVSQETPFSCLPDEMQGIPGAGLRKAGKHGQGFRRQNDTGNLHVKKLQREEKTAPDPPQKGFCNGIFSSEPRKRNSEP